ncbi:hypothetical protein [Serratia rubidaea]|uniref:Uncharacterized protein n=1 Tax=Serratia rubidaea TaxID=61652 RepID=A0A3S4WS20_SERRU|nr:hypothetical protein [Serratia rubidaea]MBH1930691.1 hypothetical protein [Serratia rubidaea]MDC6116611.1 hypothetical protein [Serratia rubidaea]MEB7586611.1 hypothetical protein [Serratia rubidaea]VEI63179.1 Uncharacterised protein [Serratia rubidaea]
MSNLFLNDMKDNFIVILKEKASFPVDREQLSIDYEVDLDEQMEKYLRLLREQEKLFSLAKSEGDDISMLSSLLKLRTHAMSLSSFFDAIVEDTEVILRLDKWPELPEE